MMFPTAFQKYCPDEGIHPFTGFLGSDEKFHSLGISYPFSDRAGRFSNQYHPILRPQRQSLSQFTMQPLALLPQFLHPADNVKPGFRLRKTVEERQGIRHRGGIGIVAIDVEETFPSFKALPTQGGR